MRIGRWQIDRLGRDARGQVVHPWEEVTLDQLSPLAQRLIAKMARSAAKDYFEGRQEAEEEALQRVRDKGIERLSAQLVEECRRQLERERRRDEHNARMGTPLDQGVPLVGMILSDDVSPTWEGTRCGICAAPWTRGIQRVADGLGGWNHRYNTDCQTMPHQAVLSQTRTAKSVVEAALPQPTGDCINCGAPWTPRTSWSGSGSGGAWHHVYRKDCQAPQAPPEVGEWVCVLPEPADNWGPVTCTPGAPHPDCLEAFQVYGAEHVGEHHCGTGFVVHHCRQSCTRCMDPERPVPCDICTSAKESDS